MLVTSCEDNVCRIFVETILPDAGLLDLEQFDPAASSEPKYHTQRHKKRFVQRLKTIRYTKSVHSFIPYLLQNGLVQNKGTKQYNKSVKLILILFTLRMP